MVNLILVSISFLFSSTCRVSQKIVFFACFEAYFNFAMVTKFIHILALKSMIYLSQVFFER